MHPFAGGPSHELGHLYASLADGDHAGQIIVNGSAYDAAYGDRNECNGTEEDALYGTQDRACSRDVKEVYERILPLGQGDIIDAVILLVCGSLSVIRSEGPLTDIAVKPSSQDQEDDAHYECVQLTPSPSRKSFNPIII